MQRFRVDLKTFLGLAMPNQCCHAVYVRFSGKKPQTLMIPIYSTTIYIYMIKAFVMHANLKELYSKQSITRLKESAYFLLCCALGQLRPSKNYLY